MNRQYTIIILIALCLITGPIFARGGGGFHGGGGGFHGGGFHGGGMHGGGMHGARHGISSHHGYSHGGHHGYSHGGQRGYGHGGRYGNYRQGQYYAGRGYWGFNPGWGWGFWPIAYAVVATGYGYNDYDDSSNDNYYTEETIESGD